MQVILMLLNSSELLYAAPVYGINLPIILYKRFSRKPPQPVQKKYEMEEEQVDGTFKLQDEGQGFRTVSDS